MRAENNIPNKIIPVKSLVESTKYSKKHPVHLPNNEYHNFPLDHYNTPKHLQPYSYISNPSFSPFENNKPQQLPNNKQKIKGIQFGSKNYLFIKTSHQAGNKNETPQKTSKAFQEYVHSTKKRVQGHSRHESDITKNFNFLSDVIIKQVSVDKTPRKIDKTTNDEKLEYYGLINDKKEFFKSVTLIRKDQKDNNCFDQKISTKIDDQTWNISKFQKLLSSQREAQPIYKDQMTKIKTDLFQKEALLFEASQKIEENQKIIKELRNKLEVQIELNHNMKSKLISQGILAKDNRSIIGSLSQIQKLNSQVIRLKNELIKNKQQKMKEQSDAFNSSKLVQLKLKQFQIQEKQRTQYIFQLKQKQKKLVEGYEKMQNVHKQLLRQKEQQLTQISHAANFYKEQFSKISKVIEQSKKNNKESEDNKQVVIRELSGEIGDLKESLKNMEVRMRELIENQEELKRQFQSKQNEITKLNQEKSIYLSTVLQLEYKLNSKLTQLQNKANLKQIQVSMMTKTCEEYNRKIDQYHKYSQKMRLSLLNYNQIQNQLKKVLIEKQQEIQTLKNVVEPNDKNKFSQKQMSPIKQGRADDKEYNRLKGINYKLIKENEKLNILVKDLDFKIYQLYKVNEGLNETIMTQLCKTLNENFKKKYDQKQNEVDYS